MKTYWYLFPIIGFIWFIYDVLTWNNTKIPPIVDQHIWQYMYPFYIVFVHDACIVGLIFYFITN
jgi:hypothetical protein